MAPKDKKLSIAEHAALIAAGSPNWETPKEKEAIERWRRRERPISPRIKVAQKDKSAILSIDYDNPGIGLLLLGDALGTPDSDSVNSMLHQLANAVSRGGKVSEQDLNFLLKTITDLKPKDQFETMLAAQMGVVHLSIMALAQRMANVENNIPQIDSVVNSVTKLTRTFAMQFETLKRHRTGGEQKLTVQQVNVGEGGQAIVGNVTTQRALAPAPEAPLTPALTHSGQAPMPSIGEAQPEMVTQQKKRKNGRGSFT